MSNKEHNKIEVQGHRGDRGNFPENSIPAFLSAVKKGVDVLELDVVVSMDKRVVVSHEPVLSSEYMLSPENEPISKEVEVGSNLYKMEYESIRRYDAGSRGNPHFPQQKKMPVHKPLLTEVFEEVEEYIKSHALQPVRYNVEIKSEPAMYGEYMPYPREFVELVMQVIYLKGMEEKVIVQSFDPAVVNLLHEYHPGIPVAFLVGEGSVEKNLKQLDFIPQVYSPHYLLLNPEEVNAARALGMKIIPWTVNDEKDMKQMIELQVDGIISDYPEKVLEQL